MSSQTIDLQEFQTKVIPVRQKKQNFDVNYTIIIQWKPIFKVSPFVEEENYNEDYTEFWEIDYNTLSPYSKQLLKDLDEWKLTLVNY